MDVLGQLATQLPDFAMTVVILYLLIREQNSHARTRRNLAKVHAKHKQDLRNAEQKTSEPTE